jgi:cold shock CspA family protein
MPQLTGIVSKVILNKGFGFITPADVSKSGGVDLFFHASATNPRELFDNLSADTAVRFEIETSVRDSRPRAVNVQLALQ